MIVFLGTAFMALVLLFLLAPQRTIAEDGPTLSVDSIPMLHPGEQATVSVRLENATSGVNMLQFAVEYNHEELRLLSTVAGSIFDSAGSPVINDQVSGIVYFNWEGDTTLSQDTILLELTFEPATTSTVNSAVTISVVQECVVANWEAEFIPIKETGTVHIEREWAIPRTATANLDGKIGLNFYMYLPDYVKLDPGAYALMAGDQGTQKKMVSNAPQRMINGELLYCFSYSMIAYEVRDAICFRLFNGNDEPITLKSRTGKMDYTDTGLSYSLYEYCEHMKVNGTESSMRALATALLDYCTVTQLYFNYHVTDGLAFSSAVNTVELSSLNPFVAVLEGETLTDAGFQTITLQCDSDNTLRAYIGFNNEANPDSFTYTVDGNPVSLKSNGSNHYVSVNNISSNHLDNMYLIGVSDGTGTMYLRCGALSYARMVVKSGTHTYAKELGNALYLYNAAANAYFN